MSKIEYVGPYDSVYIPDYDLDIERNTPTEVDDHIANNLLKQDIFKKAATPKSQSSSTTRRKRSTTNKDND